MATLSPAIQQALGDVAKLFQVSNDDLIQVTKGFGDAYLRGLQLPDQPVVMGPSYVKNDEDDGTESGAFLVLDIGWNNIYVAKLELDGKGSYTSVFKVSDIPKEIMTSDANTFFGYLAQSVKTFLTENSIQGKGLSLGFRFPFAVQKTSLRSGILLGWSKGFNIKGTVGKDPAGLLQNALDQAGLGVTVAALVNDTVASVLAASYSSVSCVMSAIYGAGTNGAYSEPAAGIAKLPNFKEDEMIINTEWGAFSDRSVLKPNTFDDQVDKLSLNAGQYLFQKMTCWFYLGEIVRGILLSLVGSKLLLNGVATDALKKYHGFSTFHAFLVEDAKDLETIKEIIAENLGYDQSAISDQDAEIIRQVCSIVAERGGKLAGAPVAALLIHQGHAVLGQANAPSGKLPIAIAIDGELFIGSQKFQSRFVNSVGAILGADFANRLQLVHVKEGGIVGAAIAAYEAINHNHG
ncbi:hypothetical protein CVT26_006415 [Gymnopilus dilepis]|uniref:Phosphotransferase n=1 Tax=Gymnopilus dilepis TaxID=231916 RepID=A0A409Y1V3_9AGAR|nr:hypothetical protein CVT26_006415 [Gymnopilus dilepis]